MFQGEKRAGNPPYTRMSLNARKTTDNFWKGGGKKKKAEQLEIVGTPWQMQAVDAAKMRKTGKEVINRDLYEDFKERVEFDEEIK